MQIEIKGVLVSYLHLLVVNEESIVGCNVPSPTRGCGNREISLSAQTATM